MNFVNCGIAFTVISLAAATNAGADIVLYQDDNYKGRSYSTQDDVENLSRQGFNDNASSVEIYNDSWELCSDADFRGDCITLRPGKYSSLRSDGMNDKVSSIRRARHGGGGGGHGGGNSIVLYQDDNYGGRSVTLTGTESNLNDEGFNDAASSVEIHHGSWDLCSDANFRGQCVTLPRGRYPSLRSEGLNDKVSSLRPSSGDGYQSGNQYGGDRPPQIFILNNGNGQVTMPTNNCTVWYNKQGGRLSNMPGCNKDQMRQADDAMARYRREQGLDGAD